MSNHLWMQLQMLLVEFAKLYLSAVDYVFVILCIRPIFRVLPDWIMTGEGVKSGEGDTTEKEQEWERDGLVGERKSPEGKARSPFYMLSRFSSSHIPRRVLAPLLRFYDHSAAGSLYARGRPGRHRLNPWLHLQRGLRKREREKWETQANWLRRMMQEGRGTREQRRRRHFD